MILWQHALQVVGLGHVPHLATRSSSAWPPWPSPPPSAYWRTTRRRRRCGEAGRRWRARGGDAHGACPACLHPEPEGLCTTTSSQTGESGDSELLSSLDSFGMQRHTEIKQHPLACAAAPVQSHLRSQASLSSFTVSSLVPLARSIMSSMNTFIPPDQNRSTEQRQACGR